LARPIVRSTLWSLTPNDQADRRDEIRELQDSINEKICDNRSNMEVVKALGDHLFLMLDIIGRILFDKVGAQAQAYFEDGNFKWNGTRWNGTTGQTLGSY
jgi:hypothetical protein